jgi:hypothetical protein
LQWLLICVARQKSKKLAKRNRLKKGGKDGVKRGCALEITSLPPGNDLKDIMLVILINGG